MSFIAENIRVSYGAREALRGVLGRAAAKEGEAARRVAVTQRVGRLQYAELLVLFVDDADLPDPDLVVDARASVLRGATTRIRPGHEAS